MIAALRILFLCSWTGGLLAQHSDEVLRLKSLGRDSLIRRAELEIKRTTPDFDPTQYNRTRVVLEDDKIRVVFANSITFLGNRTAFKSSLSLDLVDGTVSSSIQTHPPDFGADFDEYPCLKWTKESRSAVRFVIDAVNRSDEIGDIPDGKLPKGTWMMIREERDFYDITVDSWSTHSSYKVKKGSGKIYDASHKHYARDGDEVEDEIE